MAVERTIGFSDVPSRGSHKNTATAAYTLSRDDSGIIFYQNYTTATTYTLPAVADSKGFVAWFYVSQTTGTLAITAPSAIFVGGDSVTNTTYTSDAVTGGCCMVTGDGTNYFFWDIKGTWTAS